MPDDELQGLAGQPGDIGGVHHILFPCPDHAHQLLLNIALVLDSLGQSFDFFSLRGNHRLAPSGQLPVVAKLTCQSLHGLVATRSV